ncbi:chymotrypsin inhibitor-like [Hyperolius riggenbachi]|uniref:chymotrypsin inhibitor-like n=1 Tax=Hyperolius riggenbachi TaxID=752182 RepID=UPI0035A30253
MNKTIILLGLGLCFALLEVTRAESGKPCGPNMEYKQCASNCPLTCANKDDPPMCTMQCKSSKCQCLPKYVENAQGSCVLPEDCD